jgi:hypothetical protein
MKVTTILHQPNDIGKVSITMMFGGDNDKFVEVWAWGWTLLKAALRLCIFGDGGFTIHTHVSQVKEMPEYSEFMQDFEDWSNK